MKNLASLFAAFVALEHLGFMLLESFLWQKPVGLKIFNLTPEKAAITAQLAANQGVYNLFLAAAIIASFFVSSSEVAQALRVYGLLCVIVAGVVGGLTVGPKIYIVQAFPAALALLCTLLS